ncbi:SET domain-containing protein [Lindgomyces ingoldianus]|uniref:SET domain-containing protein n=1 Tax=Lindgomyces ingoldianus TaxID=673940 RepID=A0ACB6QGL1_9PLEO|nr:SET domain-containing protein [Lindgomyces ingoldianus]KAF2465698.1 SET domain-containing protein [Lindgomyces ingoldianus]
MQSMNGSSMYALRDVPGKGKGLVAIENIPKGTRILSEQPVITTPERQQDDEWLKRHISQQVDSLSEHQRQSFFSLYNLYPYQNVAEQSLGIIRTNGLPIEANGIEGGVFLDACRINHDCDNNAQKHWNQSIKRHTVHALRDIPKGEEITIYYLRLDSNRAIRQKKLQDKFGFLCSCRLCSLPTQQSQENDKRLERIAQLDDLIGRDGMQLNFWLRTLRYVDERVRLYNEQGPGNSGLPRAYLDAAQIAIANGDLARGRIFAERAVEGWRTACGSDSKEVIEHRSIAQDPAKLHLYGLSMKWKTSEEEVPQGLDPNDFDDWLWKREKPKKVEQLGQLTDLRNREIFPSFAALPNSNKVDLDFYEKVDDTYQPLRLWCFLGEIVDSITLHHLELTLTDIDDKKIPLHFNTDGRGRELAPAQIQKGHTVAVLHAQRRVFMYGDPGIGLGDPQMLKIFPVSLKKLLELNDQVQKFSTKVDGIRTCHGCSKKAASLNRCGKCLLFWYCDSGCQRTGWSERGHKANCKLLRDPGLRGLFFLKWD